MVIKQTDFHTDGSLWPKKQIRALEKIMTFTMQLLLMLKTATTG